MPGNLPPIPEARPYRPLKVIRSSLSCDQLGILADRLRINVEVESVLARFSPDDLLGLLLSNRIAVCSRS
jgi:hypothetical protein